MARFLSDRTSLFRKFQGVRLRRLARCANDLNHLWETQPNQLRGNRPGPSDRSSLLDQDIGPNNPQLKTWRGACIVQESDRHTCAGLRMKLQRSSAPRIHPPWLKCTVVEVLPVESWQSSGGHVVCFSFLLVVTRVLSFSLVSCFLALEIMARVFSSAGVSLAFKTSTI